MGANLRTKEVVISVEVIIADAQKLKAFASFLHSAAEKMEKVGSGFDHIPLMDKWSPSSPDVQVVSTKYI